MKRSLEEVLTEDSEDRFLLSQTEFRLLNGGVRDGEAELRKKKTIRNRVKKKQGSRKVRGKPRKPKRKKRRQFCL